MNQAVLAARRWQFPMVDGYGPLPRWRVDLLWAEGPPLAYSDYRNAHPEMERRAASANRRRFPVDPWPTQYVPWDTRGRRVVCSSDPFDPDTYRYPGLTAEQREHNRRVRAATEAV